MSGASEEYLTVDGRVAGRRGRETRRRLLETLMSMLVERSYRDLTVVDLAREAEVSPATFYQYFGDMDSAIEVLAEHMADEGARRLRQLVDDIDWSSSSAWEGVTDLTVGFMKVWSGYRSVLRVVDLLSAEGDERFVGHRTEFLDGPTSALADAIRRQQAAGRLPSGIDPVATGVALIAMLARVAAHRRGLQDLGVGRDELRDSMARVIYLAMTNHGPPA